MNIEIAGDDALARFTRLLDFASNDRARRAMSRALNKEGDKGRTQVRRALVKQSGMPYGSVAKNMRTAPSTPRSLKYVISASGKESNIGLFGARQLMAGVRAKPWGHSRLFKHSFQVGSHGWKVFVRDGQSRLPIRQVWGPNLGRELVIDESRKAFEQIAPNLQPAIERAVMHEFGL